jgi:hypothetical protein
MQGYFVPSLIDFGLIVLQKIIIFFIFGVFSLFRYYLPLEKGYPLLLIKHEFPSLKADLCQGWLNLAKLFWIFLNDPISFLHSCDYLPFEKDLTLYFNKLEFLSLKDSFCQV